MLNEIKWFSLFPTITEAFKPITNKICFYIFILSYIPVDVYVVVNFLFQLIFIFPLFWGMVMYANEFKTKEKQKLTEIKN